MGPRIDRGSRPSTCGLAGVQRAGAKEQRPPGKPGGRHRHGESPSRETSLLHGDTHHGVEHAGGDTVGVGAPAHDDTGLEAGAAYVFGRDAGGPGAWGQIAKLTAADSAPGDEFGAADVAKELGVTCATSAP